MLLDAVLSFDEFEVSLSEHTTWMAGNVSKRSLLFILFLRSVIVRRRTLARLSRQLKHLCHAGRQPEGLLAHKELYTFYIMARLRGHMLFNGTPAIMIIKTTRLIFYLLKHTGNSSMTSVITCKRHIQVIFFR